MSTDLKYKSVEDLKSYKIIAENEITAMRSRINGQKERIKWIDKYIFEKTPQELSMTEIEHRLGHKVIMKGEE